MPVEVARKEMATALPASSITKTEVIETTAGPTRRITSILIKEEPSEIHITKIVDAYCSELPKVPEHLFANAKRDPDDAPESYFEYKTDDSCYAPNDVPIAPVLDSEETEGFINETLTVYSVENLETGLAKVQDGFLLAAQGYKNI